MSAIPLPTEEEMLRLGLPPAPRTACLLSWRAVDANGYCRQTLGGRQGYAHRFAWEAVHGPIPADLTIDHLCREKRCIRVDHMELVSRAENTRRAQVLRRLASGWCKVHGRVMDRVTPKGRRYCSACMNVANGRRDRSKK